MAGGQSAAAKPKQDFARELDEFLEMRERLMAEIGKVIIGQKRVIDEVLAALFTGAHCLLVGVPGLAKTLLVRSIAECMHLKFKRIQFTPDLMPSDITGTHVLDESNTQFTFLPGPVFANVLLADEINRTPPKTQAALLEAMQERQVSSGNETFELPEPFFVIATQNPIEMEGTYPLPEAQLDRFMFNIHIDYPSEDEEQEIFRFTTRGASPPLVPVFGAEDIARVGAILERIAVGDHILAYVTRLVRRTRPSERASPEFVKEYIDWGAGPRAGQYLIRGAKAMAAMGGRFHVAPEDVRRVAVPVLRHRLGLNFQAEAAGVGAVRLVRMLLDSVPE